SRALVDSMMGENATAEIRIKVQGDLRTFSRSVGEGVPTESQMGTLRGNIYKRLGIDPQSTDQAQVERKQAVDGVPEALRIGRATTIAVRTARQGLAKDAPLTPDLAVSAVESAASDLAGARGDTSPVAKTLALRDAAAVVGARLRSQGDL